MTAGPDRAHPVVAEIERVRREQQLISVMAFGALIADLMTCPPARREHWWQVWRPR